MADLESFLAANNLGHVLSTLQAAGETLSTLESKLEAGRAGFLTHLKTVGLTALKDRQGLTNCLAKLKRERESGGGGAPGEPAPARKFNPKGLKKYVGPNGDCDLVGRKRGAHKRPDICAGFMRAQGKNENDIEAFNCYCCGEPPNDHADLGPAPHVEEDEPEEFDISKFAVQGAGFDAFRRPGEKKEPERTELTAEHEQMYSAGTDPLAMATMAAEQKQVGGGGATADPTDPLAAMMGGASIDVSDSADPLGLAGMERSTPAAGSSGGSGGGGSMSFEEIMKLGSTPSEAAGGGGSAAGSGGCTSWAIKAGLPEAAAACLASISPSELCSLYETGGRATVDAKLKQVEAALFSPDGASPKPGSAPRPAGTFEPYQMDLFGNKRGRCLKCLRKGFDAGVTTGACMKYEAKVVAMNHCAGPSDPSVLLCITCGCGPSDHADLGMWQTGEPMCVTLEGRRIKTLQVG